MLCIKLHIEGMACGMCEAHINDAIRRAFSVKKVTSSHKTGITEILIDASPEERALKQTIEACGYRVTDITVAPYEKKGWFHRNR